jgi:hypothetical protein
MASRYCVFCRKALPSDMRVDAQYCSGNCRVRASYHRRKFEREGEVPPMATPPYVERVRARRSAAAASTDREGPPCSADETRSWPVELIQRPHYFAERYPAMWLEQTLIGCAPSGAVSFCLIAEDAPQSKPVPVYRLSPFEIPPFSARGACRIEYLSAAGQMLPMPARLVLRFDAGRKS